MVNNIPLDAGLSGWAPKLDQVKIWYGQSNYEHDLGLKSKALNVYSKLIPSIQDKELARYMPVGIEWQDYASCAFENSGYNELGQGAFLADLFYVLSQDEKREAIPALTKTRVIDTLLTSHSWLSLLVLALCTKARILYVPKNVKLLDTLTLSWNQKMCNLSAQLLVLVLEKGAQVTVRDKCAIDKGVHVNLITGFLGETAQVDLIRDYNYSAKACGMGLETWQLGHSSKLSIVEGLRGGKQTLGLRDFKLEGENSSIEYLALSSLGENEQTALITRQQHRWARTTSSIHIKSLVRDTAQSFYRGSIAIEHAATGSDADLQQKALLLGYQARMCAIPSLEVATHDVRCRHGSATGRFNKADLWYIQSRGFDEDSAQSLLIDGFYNDHPLIERHREILHPIIKTIGRNF